jgi:hypothetical protein
MSDDLDAPRDKTSGGRLRRIRQVALESGNLQKLAVVIEIIVVLGLGV